MVSAENRLLPLHVLLRRVSEERNLLRPQCFLP
eukprot:COSAG02_NODE_5820_length_4015_cov_24.353933_1_plen_33_part_00